MSTSRHLPRRGRRIFFENKKRASRQEWRKPVVQKIAKCTLQFKLSVYLTIYMLLIKLLTDSERIVWLKTHVFG